MLAVRANHDVWKLLREGFLATVTDKAIATQLLDAITERLVLDWRKRQRSPSAVRIAVGQALDKLPEAYDNEMFEEKRNVIFDHLLASFFDDGGIVYEDSPS
jgi:type I restriction enzyme R subunit